MKRSGKKVFLGLGAFLGASAVGVTLLAAKYQAVIAPNTLLGEVPVGGLTPEAAAKKLRLWWQMERQRELVFRHDLLKKLPSPRAPGDLGITIDDLESVKQLPIEDFGAYASRTITGSSPRATVYPVRFKFSGAGYEDLKKFIAENAGAASPAKVSYLKGAIKRTPEVSGFSVDEEALPERIMDGLKGNGEVLLPLIEAPKRIPDAELEKIREVVVEFSTNFSAGQRNRSSNIRLASSKLDGVIVLPGETLSFNGTVGRRTVAGGYKEAGVYANGRHDTGIGGGICQVSTTLYNAALLANLKIKQRSNHSMPVPYVPIGRDATVDYGSLDLLFENTLDGPIAISSTYVPGKLTFRILGVKDKTLAIKIVREGHTSWGTGLKTIVDPALPPGKTKVVEKGSSGHSVTTYREIYRNGKLVERQPLGKAHYRGATRIVAVGPAAPKAAETVPEPPPVEGPPPALTAPPPPIELGPGGL